MLFSLCTCLGDLRVQAPEQIFFKLLRLAFLEEWIRMGEWKSLTDQLEGFVVHRSVDTGTGTTFNAENIVVVVVATRVAETVA